jgi:hypothetical protein
MAAPIGYAQAVLGANLAGECCGSGSFIPRFVINGVPSRIPDRSNGLRGSNGTEL